MKHSSSSHSHHGSQRGPTTTITRSRSPLPSPTVTRQPTLTKLIGICVCVCVWYFFCCWNYWYNSSSIVADLCVWYNSSVVSVVRVSFVSVGCRVIVSDGNGDLAWWLIGCGPSSVARMMAVVCRLWAMAIVAGEYFVGDGNCGWRTRVRVESKRFIWKLKGNRSHRKQHRFGDFQV